MDDSTPSNTGDDLELLGLLLDGKESSRTGADEIQLQRNRSAVPLSFAQQRLWFLHHLDPAGSAYNGALTVRLRGELDRRAMSRALDEIVRRHEVLRTRFPASRGTPVLVPDLRPRMTWSIEDLRHLPEPQQQVAAGEIAEHFALEPYDLGRGPLARALLLVLSPTDHVLVVATHHIVSDGWSTGLWHREISKLYSAFAAERSSPLAELPIQYGDFAAWQSERFEDRHTDSDLSYWREALEGLPALQLPTDHKRPTEQSFLGARLPLHLDSRLSQAAMELARRERISLFMLLLAAFQSLLARLSDQDDFAVGSPIANRVRPELEGLIGFFVNSLALRADLSADPSFRELLSRVREVCLGAYEHQDLPFEKLVEELDPEREASRNPLFQVLFALQNVPEESLELEGLSVEPFGKPRDSVRFDLECHLWSRADGLRGHLLYATDLFEAATMERFADRYVRVLETVTADPEVRLSELPLMDEAESHRLLVEWNDTSTEYPEGSGVAELFAAQARRTPEAVALVSDSERLSYGELEARSNRLARHLHGLGVGPEVAVGLCLERSVAAITSLLAIVKAGGAYVPLDPEFPRSRLAWMVQDSETRVIVSRRGLSHCVSGVEVGEGAVELVCVDTDAAAVAAHDAGPLASGTTGDSLAYIMYTSGSTGEPKGVCVEHRGVVRLVRETDYVTVSQEDVYLQLAPLGFDAATFEIWAPLLNGARLVVFAEERFSLGALGDAIAEHGVTTLWLTAALFHQMVDENLAGLAGVRQLLAGGDVLSPARVRRVLESLPGCTVINGYGPTEGTTFTCCHRMEAAAEMGSPVPIGRAIANTRVYVLDGEGRPVPQGVVGELYIGGAGVARGYLKRPQLTAARFVADVYSSDPAARLYRTGDRVRYRNDGTLEFHGRRDGQVKIRGFRVEPQEVEAVLLQHPQIAQAAVSPRADAHGDHRLVAYYVEKSDPENSETSCFTVDALRRFSRSRLPEALVPSVFVPMPQLPMTATGKVDRRALPEPHRDQLQPTSRYVAPRDDLERRLVGIWERVLGRTGIGVEDDFFDLGGHSLLGVRLIWEVEKGLEADLELKSLFKFSTVARMATMIRRDSVQPEAQPIQGPRVLSAGLLAEEYRDMLAVVASSDVTPVEPGALMSATGPRLAGQGLFWCFNVPSTKSRALAPHLDGDRSLFAMLSGVGVLNWTRETPRRLAEHYVEEIVSLQPEGPYLLGGNCAGAQVALELATQLRARGEEVSRLCLMEFFDTALYDYPGRLLLLYGEESHLEFHRDFGWPDPGWERQFQTVPEVSWIPGGHGEYFDPANVGGLAEQIRSFLEGE